MVREDGWTITAYCHCSKCCRKQDKITACGYKLIDDDHLKVCAAPDTIPFGTKLNISGGWVGTVTVKDRGDGIRGKRLNIYCKTHYQAVEFGQKNNCTVEYY